MKNYNLITILTLLLISFTNLLGQEIINPDTLYLKSGQIVPCLIADFGDKYLTIQKDKQKHNVMFQVLEKIILRKHGIIYLSDEGFQKDLLNLQEFVKNKIIVEKDSTETVFLEEFVEHPDTLYLKIGSIYPCCINKIDTNYISITIDKNAQITTNRVVNKIFIQKLGIIYLADTGFLKELKAINEFIKIRNYKYRYHLINETAQVLCWNSEIINIDGKITQIKHNSFSGKLKIELLPGIHTVTVIFPTHKECTLTFTVLGGRSYELEQWSNNAVLIDMEYKNTWSENQHKMYKGIDDVYIDKQIKAFCAPTPGENEVIVRSLNGHPDVGLGRNDYNHQYSGFALR